MDFNTPRCAPASDTAGSRRREYKEEHSTLAFCLRHRSKTNATWKFFLWCCRRESLRPELGLQNLSVGGSKSTFFYQLSNIVFFDIFYRFHFFCIVLCDSGNRAAKHRENIFSFLRYCRRDCSRPIFFFFAESQCGDPKCAHTSSRATESCQGRMRIWLLVCGWLGSAVSSKPCSQFSDDLKKYNASELRGVRNFLRPTKIHCFPLFGQFRFISVVVL